MGAAYKRVLLKLSGEALAGDKGTGFDDEVMNHEVIEISAGAYGYGLKVNRDDLLRYLKADVADLVKE